MLQASPLTYWIRISILERSPGDCVYIRICWSGVGFPNCCCTSEFRQVSGYISLKPLGHLGWCWDRQHQGSIPGSISSAPKQPYMSTPHCPTNIIIPNVKKVRKRQSTMLRNILRLFLHAHWQGGLWRINNFCPKSRSSTRGTFSLRKNLSRSYQQRVLLIHHISQSHLNTGW